MSECYTTTLDMAAAPLATEVAREAGLSARAVAGAASALTSSMLQHLGEAIAAAGEQLTADARDPLSDARRDIVRVAAGLRALRTDPDLRLLRTAVEAEAATAIPNLERHLERVHGSTLLTADVARELRRATSEFDQAVAAGSRRLFRAEQVVLPRIVSTALQDCGFTRPVSFPAPSGGIYLRASRGGTTLVAALHPEAGQLTVDVSGLSGTACEGIRDEFVHAMRRRALNVTVRDRTLHGDPRGGVLTRESECVGAAAEKGAPAPLMPRVPVRGSHG